MTLRTFRFRAASALAVLAAPLTLAGGCAPEPAATGLAAPEVQAGAPSAELPDPWPPRVGEPYPDLELLDAQGRRMHLSSLAGRTILLEPIGMNCPACNAFAGANQPGRGGLNGLKPQGGLPSIFESLEQWAGGVSLDDGRLALVHLLLYDYGMQAPDVEDARHWDEHFEVSRHGGVVLVPARDLRGPASYKMIPGFQLIDDRFVLRYDSSGHRPRHNLWQELLPALPAILDGG